MRKEDCYFLGKITRKHGLSGNVVLKLDTDQPEFYNKMESMFVEINGLLVPFFIEKQQWSKRDAKIILFKNVNETVVEQLIGKNVFMPLSSLPQLTGNQFYYHEVIAFQIVDAKGRFCGIIKEINDQTAQHYFILNLNDREVIIPVIKDWIVSVERKNQIIQMELPEGLIEIFMENE